MAVDGDFMLFETFVYVRQWFPCMALVGWARDILSITSNAWV
jgi:hypothetical protein